MEKDEEKNEVPPANTDQVLGHILQNHHEKSTEANAISQNHLEATDRGNKIAENHLEATGRGLEEHKKTNDHLEKIANKDVQKVQILPSADATDDESQLATTFFQMLRGKKGEKGDSPTEEELLELIKPLIPEPIKGEPGEKPTDEELLNLIRPLIPEVKDGDEPTDERLMALIRPLVDAIENKEDETDPDLTEEDVVRIVTPLIPKPQKMPEYKYPTAEEIAASLKGKISYEDLKKETLPNLDTFRRQSSKTTALSEVTGITVSATAPQNPAVGDLWVDIS